MSSSFRSCLAIAALALITVTATHLAKADTYQFTVVDHSGSANFLGIDDKGDFVINDSSGNNPIKCGNVNESCFEVFLVGQTPFFTTIAPALNYDNGSPCMIALGPGFDQQGVNGRCNDGHEIFGLSTTNPDVKGIYDGPNLSDLIANGFSFDGGFINANGDAVFLSGFGDGLVFAQDLTTAATPEPSSLLLLGTGCLAMLGTLRRYSRSV